MTLNQPFITIITSTYNSAETLRRCLDSVQNQTYQNIEHIIIDGQSVDNTTEIISEYANKNDSRISFWLSEPDKGIYDAWNKALPHVKGDWVVFLGSDDYYVSNDTFEKISNNLMHAKNNTDIVYGNIIVFDNTPDNKMYTRGCSWEISKKHFFKGVMIPHPAVFHRANIFTKYGFFDSSLKIAGDYEMLLRVLKESTPEYVDEPVIMMQFGGASSSPDTMIKSGNEISTAFHKNGIKQTGFFDTKLKILKIFNSISPKITQRLSRTIWDAKIKHMH